MTKTRKLFAAALVVVTGVLLSAAPAQADHSREQMASFLAR